MKKIFEIALLILVPFMGFSQGAVRFTEKFGPFHESYEVDNDFTNRNYVPYQFVREADVVWSRVTWEIIDLREKVNLPLYYPTDTLHRRKSFINAVMIGLERNEFFAYKTPIQSNAFEFTAENMFTDIQEIRDIGKREDIDEIEIRPGVTRDTIVTSRWRSDEIKQILIKEVWYFSRKDSRLRSEIIGICPIREYTYNGLTRKERLFWVYYPDMRKFLATVPVYNPANDKELYSYDDLLVYRYFNSFFVQESNVYNDRLITDYVTGREAQLESDRIKREIFDFEQDLWEN